MSKTTLRKELMTMTRDEIIDIVIEMYSSRKDAKEYLEFFLNPDVDKLTEKYRDRITKEFRRSKRNCPKARITVVKRAIKEYASFNPGTEYVIDLMMFAFEKGISAVKSFNHTERLELSLVAILEDAMKYADENLVFGRFQKGMETISIPQRMQHLIASMLDRRKP